MRDPDRRWRWLPALRRAARSTLDDDDAARRRAGMRLFELHAALHLECELFDTGLDVDGYRDELVAAIAADPIALRMLRESESRDADDLGIVCIALDEGGHRSREVASESAACTGGAPSLAA